MTLADRLERVQDAHRATVEQMSHLQDTLLSLQQRTLAYQGQIVLLQELIAEQSPASPITEGTSTE